MAKKYNFEGEGSCTTVKRIYEKLDMQYEQMQQYASAYGLTIDKSLDNIQKFYSFFDSEYYNCGDFNNFKIPYADYTLYVDDIISTDTIVFLPWELANKFNISQEKHYNGITNTWFDALISNYLENFHLLKKEYGEWLCIRIEEWITENSKGKNIRKEYRKATKEKIEREEMKEEKQINFSKLLSIALKENRKAIDSEDIELIEELIDKYKK